jgi:predicted DNA-binding transcriptional regulator AlpA
MLEKRARRIIRGWEGLRAYVPLGLTQLKQLSREGRLPKPVRISSRAIGFYEDEVAAVQERLSCEQRISTRVGKARIP